VRDQDQVYLVSLDLAAQDTPPKGFNWLEQYFQIGKAMKEGFRIILHVPNDNHIRDHLGKFNEYQSIFKLRYCCGLRRDLFKLADVLNIGVIFRSGSLGVFILLGHFEFKFVIATLKKALYLLIGLWQKFDDRDLVKLLYAKILDSIQMVHSTPVSILNWYYLTYYNESED